MSLLDKASLIVTPNAYKESKLYSVVPSSGTGDMTVVRATTATRVNSAGLIESVASNVPRIDYTNGSCPSLLVEPQRTNLATYSEQFENADWSKYIGSVSANATTSPSGILNADKFIDSTDNDLHALYKAFTISGDTTFSFYVKVAEYSKIAFYNLSDGGLAKFNISNGTIISTDSNWKNSTIQNIANGWYRISSTTNGVSGAKAIGVALLNNSNQEIFAGTGTSGIFLWGAQVEAGSYPTSYIPTVASSVTRNADVISKTGISSLIGQTEGTVFVDCIINGKVLSSNIINSEKNTDCSFYILSEFNNNIQASLFISGNPKARITGGNIAVGQRAKIAYVYKTGASKLYINGALIGTNTDTFTLSSTFDDIFFNDLTTYFSYNESVTYNSVQFYKTALTNTELAQLTTL